MKELWFVMVILFHDTKLGSKNTNFALLVSHEFDDPFRDPNEYAKSIAHLA